MTEWASEPSLQCSTRPPRLNSVFVLHPAHANDLRTSLNSTGDWLSTGCPSWLQSFASSDGNCFPGERLVPHGPLPSFQRPSPYSHCSCRPKQTNQWQLSLSSLNDVFFCLLSQSFGRHAYLRSEPAEENNLRADYCQ